MSYTRRRLRGRQPLCGIGVTSRIDVMVKPAACSERSADSRPEPGPATSTSSVRMPCSCAFLAASSAATCAAYGVDFREPLKPIVPADDQAMVLPCTSVIVIMVLLNEALTCATPEAMFFRSRRRTRVASLPIPEPFRTANRPRRLPSHHLCLTLFLLASDRLGRPLAGACIGMGPLPANRQAATMTQPTVAAKIHQPLDVHGDFTSQIALDDVVAVDHLAQLQHFLIGQLRHPARFGYRHFFHDFLGFGGANAVDILEPDHHALIGRDIDASDTGHVSCSLCGPTQRNEAPSGRYSVGFDCHLRRPQT